MGIVTRYKQITRDLLWTYYIKQKLPLIHAAFSWPVDPDTIYPEVVDSFPTLKTGTLNQLTNEALDYLETAAEWQPQHSATPYLIGQIYTAHNRWTSAIQSFQKAYELSHENPNIAWKTILLLEQVEPQSTQLRLLYKATGFNADQFLKSAEFLTQTFRFAKAGHYYRRAARLDADLAFDQVTFEFIFRKIIARIRLGDKEIEADLNLARQLDSTFTVNELTEQLHLDGGKFRLATPVDPPTVTFGTPLNYPGGGAVGIFWWASQGVGIISVTKSATYQLALSLRHSNPPPIEIAIGADGVPIHHVTLSRGDNSWQIFTLPLPLAEGIHTIDIWYLNNTIVEGKDRDAAVQWITLEKSYVDASSTD